MGTKLFKISKQEAQKISLKNMAEMDKFWKDYCANIKDSITLIVKCHLFIEILMEDLLVLVLPKPTKLLKNSRFSDKVNLLDSLSFFPTQNIIDNIRGVNVLRNNLVHELDKKITLKDIRKITKGLKIDTKSSVNKQLQASLRHIIAYLHASRTIQKLFPLGIACIRNIDLFKEDNNFGLLMRLYPYKEAKEVIRNLKL